jgi:hypothetical protein
VDVLQRIVGGGIRASTPKKYAGVSNFADPGYLDSAGKPAKGGNGKKRYPLNSAARVRNAAARFAQNKGRYTSEQQSAIMGKIRAAAKNFGVEISDDSDKKALIKPAPKAWSVPGDGGRAFSQPYNWDPFGDNAPIDPHDNQYDSGYPSDYDKTLGGRPDTAPGADVVGVGPKGGYDAHDEAYTKQQYALWLLANDEVCPGGDRCPGDTCPDHGSEENAMDGTDERQADNFGGKQAKPFGSDDDDDDRSDDGDDKEPDGDEDDDDKRSEPFDLSLAAALEKTIVTCYEMAEAIGDKDIRNMLARARRQVRDLQHIPGKDIDISKKLEELRSEFGDPDTITVSEGLRAIAKSGYADVMKPAS